jgi:hypothetical protein
VLKKPVNPAKLRAVLLQSRQKAKAAKNRHGLCCHYHRSVYFDSPT